jgi:hypothetical protein
MQAKPSRNVTVPHRPRSAVHRSPSQQFEPQLGSILTDRPETIEFTKQGYLVRSRSSGTAFKPTESCDVSISGEIENAVDEVIVLQDALDQLGRIERDLISAQWTDA